MKKMIALLLPLTSLVACTPGGGGGKSGGPELPSLGQHKASECPQILGQYHLKSDPRVVASIQKNAAGNLVLVFDTSDQLVINGTPQTTADGSIASGICSQNTIIIGGKTEDNTERAAIIRPNGTGFVVQITKPDQETLEYVK